MPNYMKKKNMKEIWEGWSVLFLHLLNVQPPPDNSNVLGKSKKVQVIRGSSKQI